VAHKSRSPADSDTSIWAGGGAICDVTFQNGDVNIARFIAFSNRFRFVWTLCPARIGTKLGQNVWNNLPDDRPKWRGPGQCASSLNPAAKSPVRAWQISVCQLCAFSKESHTFSGLPLHGLGPVIPQKKAELEPDEPPKWHRPRVCASRPTRPSKLASCGRSLAGTEMTPAQRTYRAFSTACRRGIGTPLGQWLGRWQTDVRCKRHRPAHCASCSNRTTKGPALASKK